MATAGASFVLQRGSHSSREAIMFVISGVTGHVGSVVASTLLERGDNVRVIVRDAKKGEAWQRRGGEGGGADPPATRAPPPAPRGAPRGFAPGAPGLTPPAPPAGAGGR